MTEKSVSVGLLQATALLIKEQKNRGTVCGVTNQIAAFQIWTNQKAGFCTT